MMDDNLNWIEQFDDVFLTAGAAVMDSVQRLRPKAYGYYYKILTRQGPNASGGALDYVVKGHMTGGFALVAFPAKYGNSGTRRSSSTRAGSYSRRTSDLTRWRLCARCPSAIQTRAGRFITDRTLREAVRGGGNACSKFAAWDVELSDFSWRRWTWLIRSS